MSKKKREADKKNIEKLLKFIKETEKAKKEETSKSEKSN